MAIFCQTIGFNVSFRTKKSLGQHFLTDNNIIHKILDSIQASNSDQVIEIGPGTGALTKWLYQKYAQFTAIEVDQRAIEVLKSEFTGLHVVQQDVLKVEWNEVLTQGSVVHIVGNLPYYITSPILFKVIESRHLFSEAIFMMQKEVAERLVATPSSKEYGILSVQTQLFSSPELLFDVSPNSFSPPPKVLSSVVRITFDKPALNCSDKSLKNVVRTAFNQRRKKLSNSLKPVLGDELPTGFNFDQRAEAWEPAIYADLAEHLEKSGQLE